MIFPKSKVRSQIQKQIIKKKTSCSGDTNTYNKTQGELKMNGIDRFLGKAEIYDKYRPHYQAQHLNKIIKLCDFCDSNISVAEFGSGTGKFTELLINQGYKVYAVEPNKDMRRIALSKFKKSQNYIAINATAENCTLSSKSIDLIVAAQSFHYFDTKKAKKEFKRIIKPNGKVCLIWNFKSRDSNLIKEYEELIYNYHSKNIQPSHAQDNMNEQVFKKFFSTYEEVIMDNSQIFTFDEFWGRTLSNNHAPSPDEPEFKILFEKLKQLFVKYQVNDKLQFLYKTKIIVGKI